MLCFSLPGRIALLRTPSLAQRLLFSLGDIGWRRANATWLGLALCISFFADIYDAEPAQQTWASLLTTVSSLSSQTTPYVLLHSCCRSRGWCWAPSIGPPQLGIPPA